MIFILLKINDSEHRRGNQKLTIQRNWQHRVHIDEEQNIKHNKICVGHHYAQTNTNNVNNVNNWR